MNILPSFSRPKSGLHIVCCFSNVRARKNAFLASTINISTSINTTLAKAIHKISLEMNLAHDDSSRDDVLRTSMNHRPLQVK